MNISADASSLGDVVSLRAEIQRSQVPAAEVVPSATASALPSREIRDGRYLLRFVRTAEELDAVLRLRFQVFNLELGEGLASSYQSGRDEDEFDSHCHHLLVIDTVTETVIGTYRLQTSDVAQQGIGFYSDAEYMLQDLPPDVLQNSVEVGRACISREHRSGRVLLLLWKGLAAYMAHNHRRYLFGCCSLTSQTPAEGWAAWRVLETQHAIHPKVRVRVRPGFECEVPTAAQVDESSITIPTLFQIYLRYGALVCSEPVIDRRFGTIDFLVLLDLQALDPRAYRLFFGVSP